MLSAVLQRRPQFVRAVFGTSAVSRRHTSTKAPLDPAWVKLATKECKGKDPEATLTWKTLEGIDVKPVYTMDDTKDLAKETPG
ncbi:hypothetical protein IW136_005986, partial [Coemansia sp. RSA 678]